MKKILLLIAVLALVAASCGGGDDASSAGLPVNNGDEPAAMDATCLAGEPDCQDIPGNTSEPQDLTNGADDGATVPTAAIADAATTSGQIIVSGFVVDVAGEIHLCSVLAESFPPQCGGDSITVTDISQVDPDSLSSEGNVTWTDQPVLISGEMVDGTLVANVIEQ